MDKILFAIPNCLIYMDDVLIYTENENKHIEILTLVFEKMTQYWVQLNPSKCKIWIDRIIFLGNVIDGKRIHVAENYKVQIMNLSKPTNKKQIQRLLGTLN